MTVKKLIVSLMIFCSCMMNFADKSEIESLSAIINDQTNSLDARTQARFELAQVYLDHNRTDLFWNRNVDKAKDLYLSIINDDLLPNDVQGVAKFKYALLLAGLDDNLVQNEAYSCDYAKATKLFNEIESSCQLHQAIKDSALVMLVYMSIFNGYKHSNKKYLLEHFEKLANDQSVDCTNQDYDNLLIVYCMLAEFSIDGCFKHILLTGDQLDYFDEKIVKLYEESIRGDMPFKNISKLRCVQYYLMKKEFDKVSVICNEIIDGQGTEQEIFYAKIFLADALVKINSKNKQKASALYNEVLDSKELLNDDKQIIKQRLKLLKI